MKKFIALLLSMILLFSISAAFSENQNEIVFRGIPWGTSYTDATSKIEGVSFWSLNGSGYNTYSVDEVISDNGLSFEYTDINIIGNKWSGSVKVAGYDTSDITMYFAYKIVNGKLPKTEKDSALYAAKYDFEPVDVRAARDDLRTKLISVYGEPAEKKTKTSVFNDVTVIEYWYGANDTLLAFCFEDQSNSTWKTKEKLYIVYAWRGGDKLLQEASDFLKNEAIQKEKEKYGDGNTDGL